MGSSGVTRNSLQTSLFVRLKGWRLEIESVLRIRNRNTARPRMNNISRINRMVLTRGKERGGGMGIWNVI